MYVDALFPLLPFIQSDAFPILNAYYFPRRDYDNLYEGITPVNTFRVVFDTYFGQSFDILKDRYYFSRATKKQAFREVARSRIKPSNQVFHDVKTLRKKPPRRRVKH